MIKSMTGFGRGEAQSDHKKFMIELKSLNHRYLDISIKMPKIFTYLEEKIRQNIKGYVKRGRVEAFISFENVGDTDVRVIPDIALAKEYLKAMDLLDNQLSIKNDVTLSLISKLPDVIRIEKEEVNEDEVWTCLEKSLQGALEKLSEMRESEGEQLYQDILKRMDMIKGMVGEIEKRNPLIVDEYRKRLTDRIKELIDDAYSIDDNRIIMEVAIFADKSNVTEEIVRFDSHIKQFKSAMEEDDSIGRKLDFIIQEMNREVNTIGSKANDLAITNIVVNITGDYPLLYCF